MYLTVTQFLNIQFDQGMLYFSITVRYFF